MVVQTRTLRFFFFFLDGIALFLFFDLVYSYTISVSTILGASLGQYLVIVTPGQYLQNILCFFYFYVKCIKVSAFTP